MIKPLTLSPGQPQRGATLVVALIFLIVLSLLGVAAVQNNTLQERMAGNTRDRDLAFESAEAAIGDARDKIATLRPGPWDGSATGLSTYDPARDNNLAYWANAANWTSHKTPSATIANVSAQPQYRIEKKPPVGSTEFYRVTARGFGASNTTVVILQAEFSYTP